MPKPKLGTTRGQRDKMDQLVAEGRLYSDVWQKDALDNGNFSTLVRAVATGRAVRIAKRIPSYDKATGIYRFEVDFGMGLEAMIEEGRYDWANPNYTSEWFSIVGKGLVEFEGKPFGFGEVSSNDAENRIKRDDLLRPWTPSPIAPLLGFGAAFPNVQRQDKVVGLGSVAEVGGDRSVPVLVGSVAERCLGLNLHEGDWSGVCRFLAVRLVAQATA